MAWKGMHIWHDLSLGGLPCSSANALPFEKSRARYRSLKWAQHQVVVVLINQVEPDPVPTCRGVKRRRHVRQIGPPQGLGIEKSPKRLSEGVQSFLSGKRHVDWQLMRHGPKVSSLLIITSQSVPTSATTLTLNPLDISSAEISPQGLVTSISEFCQQKQQIRGLNQTAVVQITNTCSGTQYIAFAIDSWFSEDTGPIVKVSQRIEIAGLHVSATFYSSQFTAAVIIGGQGVKIGRLFIRASCQLLGIANTIAIRVSRTWPVALTEGIHHSNAGVFIVANAVAICIRGATATTNAERIELVAVAIAIPSRDA